MKNTAPTLNTVIGIDLGVIGVEKFQHLVPQITANRATASYNFP